MELPRDVRIIPLDTKPDHRGELTELYRAEWSDAPAAIQWNMVRSEPGVLRGVHAHVRHWDYLIVAQGRMLLGLADLRDATPTPEPFVIDVNAAELRAVVVPPGVAHGFYFPEPSLFVYSVTHYWDVADELACRWDDADLGIPWPDEVDVRALSERDEVAPPVAEMVATLRDNGL